MFSWKSDRKNDDTGVETGQKYALAVRLKTGSVPGINGGEWWIVDQNADEATARQRAFRLIEYVSHLGGESVLMSVTMGPYGRPISGQSLLRRLSSSRPPQPTDLKTLSVGKATEFRAQGDAFMANVGRLRPQAGPVRAAAPAESQPRGKSDTSYEGWSKSDLIARLQSVEAENVRLRRLIGASA